MELKIYSQSGQLKATVSPDENSVQNKSVMGENKVNVSFTLGEAILFDVNDYIDFENERYTLSASVRPAQKSTLEFEYNLQFSGIESELSKALCFLMIDSEMDSDFSLTDNPRAHMQLIVNNINRIKETNVWHLGTVITAENKVITYEGVDCLSALNRIAQTFETEWWIEGTTINLCKCEHGEAIELGYGGGGSAITGLTELRKQNGENTDFFTRLYVKGSTRNIVKSSYGFDNLHLPTPLKYLEKNTEYGIIEREVIFEKVYPRRIGSITSVRSVEQTTDGNTIIVYYFKDNDLDFNPNDYEIEGLTKHIKFETGELAGYDFEANYNATTGEFELINQYPDENIQLPGGTMIPAPEDTYVLYNVRMPEEYIPLAEQELQQVSTEYLDKFSIDSSIYSGDSDPINFEERNLTISLGRRVKLYSDVYFTPGYRDSRITSFTRNLNNPYQVTLDISDAVSIGRFEALERKVDAILPAVRKVTNLEIIESTDTTTVPTEKNVYAAAKSKKEDDKRLRNDIEDFAQELINFLKGAKFGKEFISGILTGKGGMIDAFGNGELESLIIRRFLEVPELRFNRAEVFTGITWNAPGGGIIESVDTVNRIVKLKLEKGEIGSVAVGDICMGIFHSLIFSDNATQDKDDSKGVFIFAGFFTAYFTVTEILDKENKTFKYQLRPSSASYPHEFHPFEAMHFVAYGNFVNKDRQTSNYATRTYTRYLYHVDGWEFEKRQIAAQFGDLTNLSVHGYNMTGYSIFLNNIYMIGTINQMSADGTSIERVPFFKGNWQSGKSAYFDEVTHNGSIWLCINPDGTTSEPTDGNPDWFKRVSKGEDGKDGTSAEGVGEWISTRNYKKSNIVRCDGASFIAFRDNTGIKPVKQPGGYLMSGSHYLTTSGKRLYTGDPDHPWLLLSEDGKQGAQGIPGEKAIQFYTWIKYADTGTGAGMSDDPAGKSYMGIAINQTVQQESNIPADYKWSLTKGGQGVPGTPGTDGKVKYTWIKYATNDTGANLSDDPDGRDYIGLAHNKDSQEESTNPADYTWSKYKGDQGVPGKDAIQYYTWLKFADSAAGTGISDLPEGKKYIGLAVNQISPVESNNPVDYKWALIVGEGIPGKPGEDGKTLYTWVRYADDAEGTGMSNNPEGKAYIGFAYNKETATESNTASDYKWSKIEGDPGEAGLNYILEPYSPYREYRQRDLVSFAGGKIFCKKKNVGQTPVPFLSSGGKFLKTGGSYLLYKPLTVGNINSEYWDIFIPPTVVEPVEREFTTYHTSITKPSRPILTGNSAGWSQVVMTGARWKSTKKAVSDAAGSWSDPVQYSAEDGKPGIDATSYWLVSPVSNIVFNSVGTPTPSAFTVSAKQQTGKGSVMASDQFYLAARKSTTGTSVWEQHVAPVKASSINITVIAGIKAYAVRMYEKQADAQAWNSNYIDEVGVSVIRDGERGATGSMPRNCGFFDANKAPYFWNSLYRDIILYPFGNVNYIFQVKNYNPDQGISAPPTSSSGDNNWEPANKLGFVAMDTALIDGADIAGFLFKDKLMQSRDTDPITGKPYLIFNGKTGEIAARKGTFSGSIGTPFRSIDPANNEVISLDDGYNIALSSYYTNPITIKLPWDKKWNGVRCNIFNSGMTKNNAKVHVRQYSDYSFIGNGLEAQIIKEIEIGMGGVGEFICVEVPSGNIYWCCLNYKDLS